MMGRTGMLWARILADVVVVIHAAFVFFVLFGLVAIVAGLALGWGWVRNFWFRVGHLAAIAVVAAQALVGVICPLTILENALRRMAGQETYPGAFVGYWAHRLIFFRADPWVFTLAYSLFGLAVLATFCLGPPRWPRRRDRVNEPDRVRQAL
jgi:voltage-gated potassium channel Kch